MLAKPSIKHKSTEWKQKAVTPSFPAHPRHKIKTEEGHSATVQCAQLYCCDVKRVYVGKLVLRVSSTMDCTAYLFLHCM